MSFTIAGGGEASIDSIAQAEYLLIFDDQEVPQWIAEINRFAIAPGDYPKTITASLGRIESLVEFWSKTAEIIGKKSLIHAKVDLLNVEALFKARSLITSNTEGPFGSLTAKDTATRLAWTYGVQPSQVKISIKL